MDQEKGFELVLNEEAEEKLADFSRQSGVPEDDIVEFIITRYLQGQIPVIEKRSRETGVSFAELLNMQFIQLLDFLKSQGRGIE
ncbi:MAG: hypothetical protein ACOY4I_13710 [Bacillota bacterium]